MKNYVNMKIFLMRNLKTGRTLFNLGYRDNKYWDHLKKIRTAGMSEFTIE